MRIVKREEFLKLPDGTIYVKGRPWMFSDGLCVKGVTVGDDFYFLQVMDIEASNALERIELLESMRDSGAWVPMSDLFERDGCHDADELFMVADVEDIYLMLRLLDGAALVAHQQASKTRQVAESSDVA